MRKSVIYLLAAACLAGGGMAQAQSASDAPKHGHHADMTRAQAQARATAMFQKLDINHDGKIDQADRVAHQHEMFDKLDTDHNGSLSFDEFAAAHKMMEHHGDHKGHGDRQGRRGPGPMEDMRAMLMKADTNHDGAVSQAEFDAMALQRFDAMDANHDGTVTRAERRAYMQAHAPKPMCPPPPPPPGA